MNENLNPKLCHATIPMIRLNREYASAKKQPASMSLGKWVAT